MIALDTNAVPALLDGDEALAEALASTARVALPVLVIGECRYGLQRSRHRRQLAENDVWIAALCAQHEMPLLTRDEHFRQIPDLTVRDW